MKYLLVYFFALTSSAYAAKNVESTDSATKEDQELVLRVNRLNGLPTRSSLTSFESPGVNVVQSSDASGLTGKSQGATADLFGKPAPTK